MVYDWTNFILNRVFAPVCALCGASAARYGLDLCPDCRLSLPVNDHACARCALPLPASAPTGSECGDCRRRPPSFDRVRARFRYAAPIDQLIAGFKYGRRLSYGRLLALLLAEHLEQLGCRPQLLVPAPLHRRRLRERGFNQAAELTRTLARELDLPWSAGRLVRVRHTAAQAGLDRRARRRNLRGSFRWLGAGSVAHVAVVDDVVTTGATAEEMARTLKRGGVEQVEVWAVARTPDPVGEAAGTAR